MTKQELDRANCLSQFMKIEMQVYRYVYRIVPNRQEVEDIVQETALTVGEKYERYNQKYEFLPWVLGIARNKAKQQLEKNNRPLLFVEDDSLLENLLYADEEEILEKQNDIVSTLKLCLEKLKTRDLNLIKKVYWENSKINTLVSELNLSSEGLYKRLQRIRKNLHQCISINRGKV